MLQGNRRLLMSGPPLVIICLCVSAIHIVHASTTSQIGPQEQQICGGGDYRNTIDHFRFLRNCTVIEGHLKIMFYQKEVATAISKLVFPRLREITGYLLFYRVYGLKSIGRMFPNLAVIRGRELFYDYAMVVYEMPQLEDLGLRSLRTIMRGSVRLEKNPELCYVDSIDWRSILIKPTDNFILQNKMVDECDVCPTICGNMYSGKEISARHCWNGQKDHCQVKCPDHCDRVSSCYNDGGKYKCCNSECAGGCYGLGADECVACKNVLFEGVCRQSCPPNTYLYHDRRCLTEQECKNMTTYIDLKWKPFKGKCIMECPQADGYKEDKHDRSKCVPCNGPCPKICMGTQVDSVANAQRLKGCTVISTYLHIQITEGTNIVQELEENLSMIEEVVGYVKVTRSASLVSLGFLKNLKLIRGVDVEKTNNYSLYVVDNRNLQEIWNMTTHPNLTILRGSIYFDLNRRLCLNKIRELAEHIGQPNPSEEDVSTKTNGDEGDCDMGVIHASVASVSSQYALLQWKPFPMKDARHLMGYVVSYRETKFRNVSIFEQRNACGNDIWKVHDYSFDRRGLRENRDKHVHLLSELKPWTQYVVYVQTYTVAVSNNGGRSPLIYFSTPPDIPTHPRNLVVENDVPNELLVRWKPPSMPKGNVTHYHIYWAAQKLSRTRIDKRDYCNDRIQNYRHRQEKKVIEEDTKQKVNETQCDCKTTKQEKILNKERLFQIEFENYLHNYVYRKRPPAMTKRKKPKKRKKISDMNIPTGNRTGTSSGISRADLDKMMSRTRATEPPRTSVDDIANNHAKFEDYIPTDTLDTRAPDGGITTYDPDNVNATSSSQDGDEEEEDDSGDNDYHVAIVYNKLEVVLPNLRHFQTYNIEVVACQEYDPFLDTKLCSNRAIISATTQPSPTSDIIDSNTVRIEYGRRGSSHVKIYWSEPEEPNGLIVNYDLEFARGAEKQAAICISHAKYRSEQGSFTISGQPPGNYTFRIRATSVSGVGKWTPLHSFLIKEPAIEYGPMKIEYIIIMAVLILVVIVVVIVLVIWFYFYIRKQRLLSRMPNIQYSSVNPEYMSYEYTPDEWEVDREKVKLGEALGAGSFGMVYQGTFESDKDMLIQVAVKTVNPDSSEMEKRNFLREATVMKAFDCFHVVKLMGVVSKGQPALVLMELMSNGDLKSYLRSRRPDYADAGVKPPTTAQIWRMAVEIADGMAYLSSRKYVHRDLAARNCMVAEDFTVKIGDFGMTRDIYETDYYKKGGRGLLPVRWMAPESLRDGIFTSASDVWSYGVVLWEIATLAAQPYQGYSNDQVLGIVVDGGHMERPQGCPQKLYNLMSRCWQYREKERPTFGDLIETLVKDKCLDYEKFYHVSFFFTHEDEEKVEEVVDIEEKVPAVDSSPGHISPSHRISGHVDNNSPGAGNIQTCTDDCDSSRTNCKPSAIPSSCSGESSKGSVKSNGSAFTNGLANGHAHRPVNC